MRTTLTLDDDVAALLRRVRKARNLTLREAVNSALRDGLQKLEGPAPRRTSAYTQPVYLGHCLAGNLDNVEEVLATAEGNLYKE